MPHSPSVFRPASQLKAAARSLLAALPLLLPAVQTMAQADPQPAVIPLPAPAVTASKQGTTTFDTPTSAWVVDKRTPDERRLQGAGRDRPAPAQRLPHRLYRQLDGARLALFLLMPPVVLPPLLRLTFALGEQK